MSQDVQGLTSQHLGFGNLLLIVSGSMTLQIGLWCDFCPRDTTTQRKASPSPDCHVATSGWVRGPVTDNHPANKLCWPGCPLGQTPVPPAWELRKLVYYRGWVGQEEGTEGSFQHSYKESKMRYWALKRKLLFLDNNLKQESKSLGHPDKNSVWKHGKSSFSTNTPKNTSESSV